MSRETQLTPEGTRTEDYLEVIYHLIHDKGYATTVEIAEKIQVSAPSVSSKLKNLASEGYLIYEPYRGIRLTEKGEEVAEAVVARHRIVMELLTTLGVDERTAYTDAEGIEHHLHPETVLRLEKLTKFLLSNPAYLKAALGKDTSE